MVDLYPDDEIDEEDSDLPEYSYDDFIDEYGPDYEWYTGYSFEQYCSDNGLKPVGKPKY